MISCECRDLIHTRGSLPNVCDSGKRNDNCFSLSLFVCLSLWPILICHLLYYWSAETTRTTDVSFPWIPAHTRTHGAAQRALLNVSAVGIFLKVSGTSVLPLFIHAPEPLKRAKMLPTHYKTPATHGLALWCHQSGFKGSFSTINQSLVSEDPARENIWTSCAETFEELRRCCICNSRVSYPEEVSVCVFKMEKRMKECFNPERHRWVAVMLHSGF